MEYLFFKFLLVLFGFFLGGFFPMCLSDLNWYNKIFFLLMAVHISEDYWLQHLRRKGIRFYRFVRKIFSKWRFVIKLKRRIWNKNRIVISLLYFFVKIENQYKFLFQYIKLGFFFGIFVDALKVGS
jgi:hypothetical protein